MSEPASAFLYLYVDAATKQVVDAAVQSPDYVPKPIRSAEGHMLVPALAGAARASAEVKATDPAGTAQAMAKAEMVRAVQEEPDLAWLKQMPTLAWQANWALCEGVCYAGPMPDEAKLIFPSEG